MTDREKSNAEPPDIAAEESASTADPQAPADSAASQSPEPSPGEDFVATLQAQVAELNQKLAESNDRYVRARAELDNYRKRVQREFGEIRENAKAGTVQEVLSVFDHFRMAMTAAEQNADFQTLKQGMDMILAELNRTLDCWGIKTVDATGKMFDPTEHEAMAQQPSADVPAGQVLQQWKVGYRLGDRLLRPAAVVVSSGPASSEQTAPDNDQQVQ